jgi:leucyl-tRNA synthetase
MTLQTFTTRVDTLFGVTFIVLAPEHPQASKLTKPEYKQQVQDYINKVKSKSDRQRQINKEKTGVFTGSYVKHPLTNEKIPIWIADYVLYSYGTGVIMAVPAHDDRDYEFAKNFGLLVKKVIKNEKGFEKKIYTGNGEVLDSEEFTGLQSAEAREKITNKLTSLNKGFKKIQFKFRDWVFSRQRYWGEPFPFKYMK